MDKLLYAARMTEFVWKLKPNSIAIIVANPERTRSNDTEHEYRQSSDVLYLNGFPEPEAVLVVSNIGGKRPRSYMFVRPKDQKKETWTGRRQGPRGARKNFLADEAYTIDQFATVLARLIAKAENVYYRFGHNDHLDEEFSRVWRPTQKPLINPEEILHEMRLFKSPREIEIIRHACQISAGAHVEAMRHCQPGMWEYQLKGILSSVFTFNGSESVAYNSIVGGGNNAVILHYVENNAQLRDGDLVLIDAACEFRGYASDITRTFPVNGRFSEAQKVIYQLVLDAQLAALKVSKAGSTLARVHEAASRVLRRGLNQLGLIPDDVATKKGELKAIKAWQKAVKKAKKAGQKPPAEPVTLFSFFMHGTSHWMGLDVHDVGTGGTRDPRGKKRKLAAGMIFTVEPGLYFDARDKRVPAKFRGIGIRIEDDVLITEGGQEILTAGVPKEIDEIERLMSEGNTYRLRALHVQEPPRH